jgi:ketosteroid isomerase-like protein
MRTLALGLVALLAATGAAAQSVARTATTATPTSVAEVQNTVMSFAEAVARGDSTTALTFIHPDLVVFQDGESETLDVYRGRHLAADLAMMAAVRPQTLSEQLMVVGETALYTRQYRLRGTFRGKAMDTTGTETLLLVSTPRGWKVRHIHWSTKPQG